MATCPKCGYEAETPAMATASRMPPGVGVIWSEHHTQAVVYQLHVDGRIESARLLAGEFLELDDGLKLAIARDLASSRDKG